MIFISVGTTDRQFNRLVKEVDELVGKKSINEKIILQSGFSTYKPKNLVNVKKPYSSKKSEWFNFVDDITVIEKLNEKADIVVTHGGAGCISVALRYNKPLIVVPRLEEYDEHYNNHQIELGKGLESQDLCICVTDIKNLEDAIKKAKKLKPRIQMQDSFKKARKEIAEFVGNKKTCIAFNPGGHFTEAKPFLDLFKNSFYVVMKTDFTPKEVCDRKFYLVVEPNKAKYTIRNIVKSFYIIMKEKPKIIFSTGAGLAVTLSYFAKLIGAKIIYIESFAQTTEKSWTGRLIYPISSLFYVRWKTLEKKYGKKAKYVNYIY